VLICLPSMVAPSGPHNFARISLHLNGLRDVYALPLPGFGDGEPLPASAELVIDMQAQTIAERFGDVPFVLAGYSSGGWLAHGVASRLEMTGPRPAGVMLLDTWLPDDRIPEADIQEELRGIAVNDQAFALMTEAQVTAQGAYLDLFEHWKPGEVRVPVGLVRALQRMPQQIVDENDPDADRNWATDWDLEYQTIDAEGNHQTMMNEHAASTAQAMHRWLDGMVSGASARGEGGA
jgi:thioesterase domain-containing protein